MTNNILFQDTLWEVDDFYETPRDLLWCKNCYNPIEKGGLRYVNIQTKPFDRINECFFHSRCFNENICRLYCNRPKSPCVKVFKHNIQKELFG